MFTRFMSLSTVLSLFLFQAALHAGPLPGHETVNVYRATLARAG